ncbi:MAG TPA: nitroreductase family protein [Methanomassiliicoccales archaeon]|jgi:nitroreductase
MGAMETIENRRSIRKYQAKEIPQDVLLRVLEAARLAPSGANRQPFQLIVVTDPEKKKGLVPLCKNQQFVGEASVFIAGVDDPQQKWNRVDLSIAMDHITLAALEHGLGTCWVGAFDPEKLAAYLEVPKDKVITVCLALGYPNESPEARSRKAMDDLVFWDSYGNKAE